MIIIFSKQKIYRVVMTLLVLALLTGIIISDISRNLYTYVYNYAGTADEERDYWLNSEDIFWDIRIQEKAIAITFDDGPHPIFTPQILDILNENGAKATFFVLGRQVDRFPDVAIMIAESGNEIANHTYSHPDLRYTSLNTLKKEIEKNHQLIKDVTGVEPVLFRPPSGYYNKKIIDTIVKQTNYKIIMWSFTQDTRDWSNPGVEKIVKNVLNNAQNGDIIIFHDCGGNRTQTVDALKLIVSGLKEQGYSMVTVSELLDMRIIKEVN